MRQRYPLRHSGAGLGPSGWRWNVRFSEASSRVLQDLLPVVRVLSKRFWQEKQVAITGRSPHLLLHVLANITCLGARKGELVFILESVLSHHQPVIYKNKTYGPKTMEGKHAKSLDQKKQENKNKQTKMTKTLIEWQRGKKRKGKQIN